MKQAFPTLEQGGSGLELTDTGMSLRDYFAAKAMKGLFTQSVALEWADEWTAEAAYRLADAMMKARGES